MKRLCLDHTGLWVRDPATGRAEAHMPFDRPTPDRPAARAAGFVLESTGGGFVARVFRGPGGAALVLTDPESESLDPARVDAPRVLLAGLYPAGAWDGECGESTALFEVENPFPDFDVD